MGNLAYEKPLVTGITKGGIGGVGEPTKQYSINILPRDHEVVNTETQNQSKIKWYSDVVQKDIDWFWYPYIRNGAVNTFTAVQSTGKSILMCKLCAMSSRGKRHELPLHDLWEHYTPFDTEPEKTLFLNAEDDPDEDTIGRLKACKADFQHIAYVEAKDMGINFYSPDIVEWLKEVKPKLIIFDPVQQFFTGVDPSGVTLDMNNSASVRPVMTYLKSLAREYNCAIVLICHPNKNSFQSALYSTMGSNDFTAAPRSAIYIGLNPDDKEQRVICVTKANSIPDTHKKSLTYRIDFKNGGVVFTGESELQADDVRETRRSSKKAEDEAEPKKTKREQAEEIIMDAIEKAGGYIDVKEVEKITKAAGLTSYAMYSAQAKMPYIKHTKNGAGRTVFWFLEGHEPPEQMTLKQ